MLTNNVWLNDGVKVIVIKKLETFMVMYATNAFFQCTQFILTIEMQNILYNLYKYYV